MNIKGRLFRWLLFSVLLNTALLFMLIYMSINNGLIVNMVEKDRVMAVVEDESQTLFQYWEALSELSLEDLRGALSDESHLEYGYKCRDIALSYMVTNQHLAIDKIISDLPSVKVASDRGAFVLYDLDDSDFEKVYSYLEREKYPLTILGLLNLIDQEPLESLSQAIYLTPEYMAFEAILAEPLGLDKGELVEVMRQNNGKDLLEISVLLLGEHSHLELCELLESCVRTEDSRLAANIMVALDREYVVKKLDNSEIAHLKDVLKDQFPIELLKQIAESPRKDSSEVVFDAVVAEAPSLEPKVELYTVRSGDTLWKIARDFDISIDTIEEHNRIRNSIVWEGMRLKIVR